MVITFETFKFDRAAKERVVSHDSIEVHDSEPLDMLNICSVLRLLHPQATGTRITIL